jgi:hypothetical protein
VLAADPDGASWGSPVEVATVTTPNNFNSLAEVNGLPAIAYKSWSLHYVRAEDASGSSWAEALDLGNNVNSGAYVSMEIVEGQPAIAFIKETDASVQYIKALDADGATWNDAVTVAEHATNWYFYTDLHVVNGRPAIAFHDNTLFDLLYVRADDSSGSSWPIALLIDGAADACGVLPSLSVIDGNPTIVHGDATDLRYVRAENEDGY